MDTLFYTKTQENDDAIQFRSLCDSLFENARDESALDFFEPLNTFEISHPHNLPQSFLGTRHQFNSEDHSLLLPLASALSTFKVPSKLTLNQTVSKIFPRRADCGKPRTKSSILSRCSPISFPTIGGGPLVTSNLGADKEKQALHTVSPKFQDFSLEQATFDQSCKFDVTRVDRHDELAASSMKLQEAFVPTLTNKGDDEYWRPLPLVKDLDASLLHRYICFKTPLEFNKIQAILARDPAAATRPCLVKARIHTSRSVSPSGKQVKQPYRYPINLALKFNASADIIRLLIDHSSKVLIKPDGCEQESSLSILLKHNPHDALLVNAMIFAQPRIVQLLDRRGNSPLHAACKWGAPLEVIKHLFNLFPPAIHQRNFDNLTPLEITLRASHKESETISIFLRQKLLSQTQR